MSTSLTWNHNDTIGTITFNRKNTPVYINNLCRLNPLGRFYTKCPLTNKRGIDISTGVVSNGGTWSTAIAEFTKDKGVCLMVNYFNNHIWDQLKCLDVSKGDCFGYFTVVVCGNKFDNWDQRLWTEIAQKLIDERKW